MIEGANTILPRLNLPDWSVTLVIVLALAGLPLTVVIAWAYDVTPEGVRRTEPQEGSLVQAPRMAPTMLLLLFVGVLVAAGFIARGLREPPSSLALDGREFRSIAVLPFQNAGSNAEDEYLSEGIAEELLHRLSRVSELRVAARTSSFAFRQGQIDVREIGSRLNVDVVLEGSVRSVGTRLRISARLVSTSDGYQLWSEVYDKESADIFRLQDEISSAIVARLGRRSTGDGASDPGSPLTVQPPAMTAQPESYEAFQLYTRGRYEWSRRTEAGLRSAVRYFEQAIARAPDYAKAHLGLADASAVLGFYDYVLPTQAFPSAREAASRALQLDPTLTEAHASLAYVALYHDYDFASAEEGFRRAIALQPRYAVAHQWYGNLLTAMGRFAEAQREMGMAQEYDPLALIGHAGEGWVLVYARDYDRAIMQFESVLERDSTYFLAVLWLGTALDLSGRHAEAVPVLRRALRLAPHSVLAEAALACALAASGESVEAGHILAGLEARSAREYVASYDIALIHLALGNTKQALERLERAASDRAHAVAFLAVDPRLDALRTEPRFSRLMQRVSR